MDVFVKLVRLLVPLHAAVAAGDHQTPLDFARLDFRGALEELDRAFVEFALHIPGHGAVPDTGTQTRGGAQTRLQTCLQTRGRERGADTE